MSVHIKYVGAVFLQFVSIVLFTQIIYCLSPSILIHFYMRSVQLVISLFIAFYTFEFTKRWFLTERVRSEGKAIFITGCDSGFGHFLAKRLDAKGFRVFAGCLFPSGHGAKELKEQCSNNLQIIGLDIRSNKNVEEAYHIVENNLKGLKLWAVVNNAGVAKGTTTELTDLQCYYDTMEVNAFGMVKIVKAFLPLLKKSRGRLINVTSLHAKIAVPHHASYSMSKHAAAGLSDTLRQELAVWGIKVIQIEPEIFRTPITDNETNQKIFDSIISSVPQEIKEEYGEKYFEGYKNSLSIILKWACTKTENVVDAMESAVISQYPDIIYKPSRHDIMRIGHCFLELLPHRIRDFIIVNIFCNYLASIPKPIKSIR